MTRLLAPHFQQVIGIDPSASQIANVRAAANVTYRRQGAEKTDLPASSVDLIVAAQAAHWFDLDAFYAEVRRIAKPGALLALVSYGVPYIADPVNTVFQQGYWQDVHRFWPAERVHVETGYAELYFPYEPIEVPAVSCHAAMTLEAFIGYIRTWSAYAAAQREGEEGAFAAFFQKLTKAWGGTAPKPVYWPVSVRAGRVH